MKNSDERSHYCVKCMQDREAKHFEIWLEDKTKGRICDRCQDELTIKVQSIQHAIERKAKAEALKANETRILVDHSSEDSTKKAVETRRKLEAKLDELRIKKEFDYE